MKKTNQKEFRIENEIKWRHDKLYIKWKGYNNSFNSWIDENECKLSEYFPKSKPLGWFRFN